ncbi:MAG: aspartate/glutamate racemase family protein [Patescibacteria group bacterium]
MKTIGIIGGMSWHSSLEYYRIINETIQNQLGGWHSAKILMQSVDFDEIDLEHSTVAWEKSDKILTDAAKNLERGGADFIILAANTVHILADEIQNSIQIPLLHIVEATADKIISAGYTTVGLMGTKLTMREKFYKDRMREKHGINILLPDESEQDILQQEINNACQGIHSPGAREKYLSIINNLANKGSEAVILGCTEIPLLVQQADVNIPLFDTMRIHAETAAEYALK